MKILKQGTLPEARRPRVYHGTCRHCRCAVECAQFELRELRETDEQLSTGVVTCPTAGCGRTIQMRLSLYRSAL